MSFRSNGDGRLLAHLISKSCISCRVRVLATSSNCRMFSSRRLTSASGCRRIVAAGASSDKDGCCTTIVAWVDRLPAPPAFPPFGYEKFHPLSLRPGSFWFCGSRGPRRRRRGRRGRVQSSRPRPLPRDPPPPSSFRPNADFSDS